MTLPRISALASRLVVSAACSAVFIASAGLAGPAVAQAPKRPPKTAPATPAPAYFPDRFDWQRRSPSDAGMDAVKTEEAVQFAVANENPATKDLAVDLATTFGAREPFDTPIGPVKDRGAANGLIIRHGYIVAEWGDPTRVDMTFSVTKTFLTTVVGLAWQRGLIRDVNDFARDYMPPNVDLFEARTTRRSSGITCCGRRATGRARCGASRTGPIARWARRRRSGRTASCCEPGHALQVQRRPRERAGAGCAPRVAPAAARRAARGSHGADRRVVDLALVRLRQLVDRARRPERAVGDRRRALGRRHVHQRVRHGALRLPVPAQRQVEGPADRVGEVDRDGAHAGAGQRRLRLRELVPEHRPEVAAGGAASRASRFRGNG